MDEDISDEEIGPSSALRKAAVPEPEVNEHVRVTTPDEVHGLKGERLITPEEERVPSPLEQRVPSYHLENQGPSAFERQVPFTPLEERVPTLEQQVPTTPLEQPPPRSPLKEQVPPPFEEQITRPAEQQQDDARNIWGGPSVVAAPESGEEEAQSEELKIPGSFDMEAGPPTHQQHPWIDMLRHLHLKQ